ncbi:hypothetical protein ACFL0V_06110 [Nanoarchaeota archaeon]
MKKIAIIALMISVLMLVGCAPQMKCSEPNTVINNECCLDADDNDICDSDEEPEPEPEPESEPEPQIDRSYNEKPEPEPQIDKSYEAKVEPAQLPNTYEPGISKIRVGEPKQWLQIHELSAFRTSRDKGYMDYMVYTVRNLGSKEKSYKVDMYFENGVTSSGAEKPVGKEYNIEKLEPGEKITVKQSLGIYFHGIEESKDLKLSISDPMVYPREDINSISKTFKPTSIFEDMEIYTYGKDD